MTGTAKQIAWAEDIKAQVMAAANEVYEASMDKKQGLSFEQTEIGHMVTFADEHLDAAKAWIDGIGYSITDYDKRNESSKSIADLKGIIISGLKSRIYRSDDADLFCDEEKELKTVRRNAMAAYQAAKKAAKAN